MLRFSEIMFKLGGSAIVGGGGGWEFKFKLLSNARRKLLNGSKKVDGFVQDALARNCFDDCFST